MKQSNTKHLDTNYLLLDTFKEYLIIKGFTKQTQNSILNLISRFVQWITKENIQVQNISYNDIVAYVNDCKKMGNKQRTIQANVSNIKHYYNFLVSEKQIEDNPCTNVDIKGVKRKTLYETFTPEELEDIYKQYKSDNHLIQKRNKIIIGLMIYQGLRSEELARLTIQDVKVREGKIWIQGSRRTNERELKLEAHQVYDLMDYINETRKQILEIKFKNSGAGEPITNQLFISIGSGNKLNNSMQKLIQQLKKQNKKMIDAQQIRASVISNWLKQYNIRKAQVMAGHRYISSTEAYQANNMDTLKEDINKYHPIG